MRRYECEDCQFYRDYEIVLPNGKIDNDDCSMHLNNDDEDDKEPNDDGHYCENFVYNYDKYNK